MDKLLLISTDELAGQRMSSEENSFQQQQNNAIGGNKDLQEKLSRVIH